MSLKEHVLGQAQAVLSVVDGLQYVAPELMGERVRTVQDMARGLVKLAAELEIAPKTPEQMLAELRDALGVPATDSHADACSYAREQASQARLYRDVRDIVGDRIPF